jgi:hypothetical protein
MKAMKASCFATCEISRRTSYEEDSSHVKDKTVATDTTSAEPAYAHIDDSLVPANLDDGDAAR